MSFAIRQPATRPVTILIASMVLAASAAVALTADTHAAKPVPNANGSSATCAEVLGKTTYTATFNLSANKGKWLFVQVEFKLGDAPYALYPGLPDRVETALLEVSKQGPVPHETSAWRITFTDRKGVQLDDPITVPTRPCSVTG